MFCICEYRFSFEITPYGEILRVYHPPEENTDVLMVKKGFAALLASKLHNQENVSDSAQHKHICSKVFLTKCITFFLR